MHIKKLWLTPMSKPPQVTKILLPTQSKDELAVLAFRTVHQVKFINTPNDNILFQLLKIQWCYIDWSKSPPEFSPAPILYRTRPLFPTFCVHVSFNIPGMLGWESQLLDSQWEKSFATGGTTSLPFPFNAHFCTGFYIRKMRDTSS